MYIYMYLYMCICVFVILRFAYWYCAATCNCECNALPSECDLQHSTSIQARNHAFTVRIRVSFPCTSVLQ